jgi:hypothetical protein
VNDEIDLNLINSFMEINPNPANSEITVNLKNNSEGKLRMTIFDNSGKEHYQFNLNKSTFKFEHKVNISNLIKGIYFIKIEINGEMIKTKSFVKE